MSSQDFRADQEKDKAKKRKRKKKKKTRRPGGGRIVQQVLLDSPKWDC